MSSSSTGSSRGSMFAPRSTSGRWIMLLIIAWLIWLMINHPSEGIDLIQAFFGGIGDIFSAIFRAYQEARN